jgi:DNA polymerase-1
MIEAFNITMLQCDGCEADDIIGTLVKAAEPHGFTSYMVTPDKDFGQLVSEQTFLYKPSRMGDGIEIMGVKEILARWGIERVEQVRDILGLMGDASDNIPGVPGIGEKTASKLIAQFGSIENMLERTAELKGKLKENVEANRDIAIMSKKLATIHCDSPVDLDIEKLKLSNRNDEAIKTLCVEFEFNTIGRRLYGDEFKAGRGFSAPSLKKESSAELDFSAPTAAIAADLKTIKDVAHEFRVVPASEVDSLIRELTQRKRFSLALECSHPDPKQACITGLAFATEAHKAAFVEVPTVEKAHAAVLNKLASLLGNPEIEIVGHDLKRALGALRWYGVCVNAILFDTMIAHSLLEPEQRHSLRFLTEACLGYTPMPATAADELNLQSTDQNRERAMEEADLALRLRDCFQPQLKEKQQQKVFYDIEAKLIPALVEMEHEGIRVDAKALADFGEELGGQIQKLEREINELAGGEFNLNSPKQLGEVLFERLKLVEKAKKTKTGQYATNEQVLQELAGTHPVVQKILDYRAATKLKSTYVDTLPGAIWGKSGRIHTTFRQTDTSTGRLASDNPNLQNIPIRTELGREIRKAFVPRDENFLLMSADYSQIELRIIAALGRESGLIEAFRQNLDIHTATAARVFGVFLDLVTPEMRRKAKMVNYGIAYGISAFGLAQRLGIPRKEAAEIIEHYFTQFPGVRRYMSDTIEFAREHGYVETVTGRRRYMRDIRSSNGTVRAGAERNAINAPIQGTAADMIKIAMANIHRELCQRGLETRMLLTVHDELVFDLHKSEEPTVRSLVEDRMRNAIALEVPIVVEIGVGQTWLEAH